MPGDDGDDDFHSQNSSHGDGGPCGPPIAGPFLLVSLFTHPQQQLRPVKRRFAISYESVGSGAERQPLVEVCVVVKAQGFGTG